jgi:chloramphenicol 3-O phosphotransferase
MVGLIIVLNGVPRSGKSSIVAEIQSTFDGIWINLGVDLSMQGTPERYFPGIGLRPGGERPDLEPIVQRLYAALYESIAAHSRCGINVVADFGHHDSYSVSLDTLRDGARRLAGLPAMLVGVRCPIETVMERRRATGMVPPDFDDFAIPAPVVLWQEEVHRPGCYDLEVDTSVMSPAEGAKAIAKRLSDPDPLSAFRRLASMD